MIEDFDWVVYAWHVAVVGSVVGIVLTTRRRPRMAPLFWMVLNALVLLPLLLWGMGCSTPGGPTEEVTVTDEAFAGHWAQLERRSPLWFTSIGVPVPALPPASEVRARVHFVELESSPDTTCYFDPRGWTIKVGADRWASGCVPHELGHAALHLINHPCASYFEHPADTSRCLAAQ